MAKLSEADKEILMFDVLRMKHQERKNVSEIANKLAITPYLVRKLILDGAELLGSGESLQILRGEIHGYYEMILEANTLKVKQGETDATKVMLSALSGMRELHGLDQAKKIHNINQNIDSRADSIQKEELIESIRKRNQRAQELGGQGLIDIKELEEDITDIDEGF